MTTPSTASDFAAGFTGGNSEHAWLWKDNRTSAANGATPVQGRWQSLWQMNGSPGGFGSAPGAAARYPTRTTAGALGQTNPGGGRKKWLTGITALLLQPTSSLSQGKALVYDRLADTSGMSGTVTTQQHSNPLSALTRYNANATCIGNVIALEIYTQIGVTSRTATVSYTNQAGTSARTSQAVPIANTGAREAQCMILVPLASGDTGVQAVEGVTLSGTTGTAGDFGVTILRPLIEVQTINGIGTVRDLATTPPGLQEVLADACIAVAWFASILGAPQLMLHLPMVEQ